MCNRLELQVLTLETVIKIKAELEGAFKPLD
jgi:hypothetical protein